MSTLARLSKFTGRVTAGLLAVSVLFYAVLLLLNLHDQPPSDATDTMQQLQYSNKPEAAQTADNNGYLYLVEHGRSASYQLATPLAELLRQCTQGTCQQALAGEPELVNWVNQHQPLADFYQLIRSFSYWYEPVPVDPTQALPSLHSLLNGQQLLLAQAWLAAQQQDTATVQQLLQQDLQFWRTLLPKHNLLINKLVNATAIERHLRFALMLKQQLAAEQQTLPLPDSWRMPFTEQELSMLQVFSGEWVYGNAAIAQAFNADTTAYGSNVGEKLVWQLVKPLYQPQATSNQRASQLLAQARQEQAAAEPWYSWLYNPTGKLLNSAGADSYARYQLRLEQLEPLRQQLLNAAL